MSRSVCLIPLVSLSDPHIYVIYTSTEVHQIQYMCLWYITDTSSLCHVKVSLSDSRGQSVWYPYLCHIYIHRSPSNTIYVSLLYHWHIPSMLCQGQSGWFPWSVCLIPTSIYTSTEVHQIQYMCPYYITDTSPLCHVKISLADSSGQSVWSPHLWHIYIYRSPPNTTYMPLLYFSHIPLCHVKVSLADSFRQSA